VPIFCLSAAATKRATVKGHGAHRLAVPSILGFVLLAIGFLMSCSSSATTPPQTIAATDGTPQGAPVGTTFAAPLQATVTAGLGVSLVPVTFTVQPSTAGAGATFANGTATETDMTSSSGVVYSSALTANTTLGSYTVVATTPGTATMATFDLTNNGAAPATITATSGVGQTARVSTALASPLVATVLDSDSNPVVGVTVTFTAPSSGASGTFASNSSTKEMDTTDSSGVATSSVFTANAVAGSFAVTANSTPVSAIPASFTLTNDQ
jgi:hypothetical protein